MCGCNVKSSRHFEQSNSKANSLSLFLFSFLLYHLILEDRCFVNYVINKAMLLQCISSFLISFPPRTQGYACQDCIFMQLLFFSCTIWLPPRTKTFCLWRCPEEPSILWRVWALAPLSCCCFPEIMEAGICGLLCLTGLSQDAFRSLTWPPGNALSGNGRLSLSRLWCSCTSYGSSSSSGWGSEWFSLWRDLLSQWSHSRGDGCWDPATISYSVAESWKQMVTKSLLFF